MTDFPALARIEESLAQLDADSLLRKRMLLESAQGTHVRVDGRDLVSFCSNDYLGLANDPAIARAAQAAINDFGVGAGASHLVTGHHRLHHEFEEAFARFVGKPSTLLFSTGYMANIGVLTALVGRHGEVFADKLNHASLNDAAQQCGAKFTRYAHSDLDQLEEQLKKSTAQDKLICTDLVFSMDGDVADVDRLFELADTHDAWLYLDDAHGFGVLNKGHGGMTEAARKSDRVIYLATLGKAAGVFGAAVAAHAHVIDWLVQKAKPYIYTTATPPMLSAALIESLKQIEAGDLRREILRRHVDRLREGFKSLPQWHLMDSDTPIQPLVVGENAEALKVSKKLLKRGLLVPAIRTPTVPKGSARLRISLSAGHTEAEVEMLVSAIRELAEA